MHYVPKRAGVFKVLRIHNRLSLVTQCNKEEPGEREEENEAVHAAKRDESIFRTIFTEAIKPKQLRKHDKGKRGVTGLKQNGKKECSRKEISFFGCS